MDIHSRGQALKTLLEEDCRTLIELINLLEHERKAITKGRSEDRIAINEAKHRHIEFIQQLTEKRKELFNEAELPNHPAKMDELIEKCPSEFHVELKQLWRRLQSHLNSCNKLNTINASIASSDYSSIQEIIDIMSGKQRYFDLNKLEKALKAVKR